jgi:hypothetical protein
MLLATEQIKSNGDEPDTQVQYGSIPSASVSSHARASDQPPPLTFVIPRYFQSRCCSNRRDSRAPINSLLKIPCAITITCRDVGGRLREASSAGSIHRAILTSSTEIITSVSNGHLHFLCPSTDIILALSLVELVVPTTLENLILVLFKWLQFIHTEALLFQQRRYFKRRFRIRQVRVHLLGLDASSQYD